MAEIKFGLAFLLLVFIIRGSHCTSLPYDYATRNISNPAERHEAKAILIQYQTAFPNLEFLGKYENKHYYLDRTYVSQFSARANCASMGMTLARLNSEAEFHWMYNILLWTPDDDLLWTDSRNYRSYEGFVNENREWIPDDVLIYWSPDTAIGLLFWKNTGTPQFRSEYATAEHYYLCQLES